MLEESKKYNPLSLPNAQTLLEKAARNGQAETDRFLFDTLPECGQKTPWEPTLPESFDAEDFPKTWSRAENGVVHAALDGTDPPKVIKVLLDAGLSPNFELGQAGNLLSSSLHSTELVKLLLEKGADPNGQYLSQTYVARAAALPTVDVLNLLVKHGARLEGSPLRKAAEYRRIPNVERLLELGQDINEVFTETTYLSEPPSQVILGSALHSAVQGGRLQLPVTNSPAEMVRFLLGHGAKANILNGEGKTAFQLAKGREDIVQAFKDHGVTE